MTIRSVISIAAAFLAAVFIGCATESVGRRGGLSSDQVAAFPPDVAKAYDVFAHKCSRCHTLARPLSASITDFEHWKSYVARMRRHAGSGISPADADTILVFLRYYAEQKAKGAGADEAAGGGARP